MKLKENSIIITISLFPLILLLSLLRFVNFLKSNLYDYLIILMSLVFFFYFIISLFLVLDEIINSNNKSRIIWVILFSIFYLPIYYTKYVSKGEKYLGFLILISSIVLSIGTVYFLQERFFQYIVLVEKKKIVLKTSYEYSDKNKLFTIHVDNNYRCDNKLGDYALSCDSYSDDSFFGVYVYNDIIDEDEVDEILSFHIEQTLDYISENNYEASISYLDELDNLVQIEYNDMVILITEKNYIVKDKTYNLIIVKELPKSENAIINFIKNINSIKFIS